MKSPSPAQSILRHSLYQNHDPTYCGDEFVINLQNVIQQSRYHHKHDITWKKIEKTTNFWNPIKIFFPGYYTNYVFFSLFKGFNKKYRNNTALTLIFMVKIVQPCSYPTNPRRWPNGGLMLSKHVWRTTPALGQRSVLARKMQAHLKNDWSWKVTMKTYRFYYLFLI